MKKQIVLGELFHNTGYTMWYQNMYNCIIIERGHSYDFCNSIYDCFFVDNNYYKRIFFKKYELE